MIIRNPPSAFEPTSAWFQGFYASLKLAGVEAIARVRFCGASICSLASIMHSALQAACAAAPEAAMIVETADDIVDACISLERRFIPTDTRAESRATDDISALQQLHGQTFEEFATEFVRRRTAVASIYLNRLMQHHLTVAHAHLMDRHAEHTALPGTTLAQVDMAIASARRAARTELAAAHPEHTAIQTLIARAIPTSSCSRDTLPRTSRIRSLPHADPPTSSRCATS